MSFKYTIKINQSNYLIPLWETVEKKTRINRWTDSKE